LGEIQSSSGSVHQVVDAIDPYPNCICRFQMEIWLRDRDACNWLYLLILST